MNFYLIKSYFSYFLKSRHRKGYGIHSPFVFNLVRELFYDKHVYYSFEMINSVRKQLLHSSDKVLVNDYGAGSSIFGQKERKIADLVKYSSVAPKYGKLLFKLVNYFSPASVVELGTSLGISTSYISKGKSSAKVYTIEACEKVASVAAKTFRQLECENVNQIVGQFRDVLPHLVASLDKVDMVFFDGHHDRQATLDYFNICLSKAWNDSVFIFDDIHWSEGMSEAWKIIYSHPDVTVSIDLFQFGIVFFRKECQKQHFVVRF